MVYCLGSGRTVRSGAGFGATCVLAPALPTLLCTSRWGLMTAKSLGQLVMKKVGISNQAQGQDGSHLLVAREPRTRPLQAAPWASKTRWPARPGTPKMRTMLYLLLVSQ